MSQAYCPHCKTPVADPSKSTCKVCGTTAKKRWPTDALLGQVVDSGRYRVEQLIGMGGFGRVYRVHHTLLPERPFAMKILTAPSTVEPRAKQDFLREGRLLLGFDHPGIVRCHDVGRLENGALFLRMEFIEGRHLRQIVSQDGLMAPRIVAQTGALVADALGAAHDRDILHRDIKPANILITFKGEVKLIDFGIAKILGQAPEDQNLSRIIGTPRFMAPEQVRTGQLIDGKLDVYQLGAVLHFALTGSPPYFEPTRKNTYHDLLKLFALQAERQGQDGPRPSTMRPELLDGADALDALVSKMLAPDPDRRPTAVEASKHLREAMRSIDGHKFPSKTAQLGLDAPAPHLHINPTANVEVPANTTLAVQSLLFRGPAEKRYVAEAITDELIDLLCARPELRVRAQPFAADPKASPERLGRILGVGSVVAVQMSFDGPSVLLRARLIAVEGGIQLWSRRFEMQPSGLYNAANTIASEIVAALTNTPPTTSPKLAPDASVADLYLRARHHIRRNWYTDVGEAVTLLDEARKLVPDDPFILSTSATAYMRRCFLDRSRPDGEIQQARAMATRALSLAPKRSEPRYPLALADFMEHRLGDAIEHLRKALSQSSAHAEAHDLLGRILCETGPLAEGMLHLEKVLELDPGVFPARIDLARAYGLVGQWERSEALLHIPLSAEGDKLTARFMKARMRMWRRLPTGADPDLYPDDLQPGQAHGLRTMGLLDRGTPLEPDFDETMLRFVAQTPALRVRLIVLQFLSEIKAWLGDTEACLRYLEQAAIMGLTDTVWLVCCPLFLDLHTHPAFHRIHSKVTASIAGPGPRSMTSS